MQYPRHCLLAFYVVHQPRHVVGVSGWIVEGYKYDWESNRTDGIMSLIRHLIPTTKIMIKFIRGTYREKN